jgi:copper chaperone CopZ
MKPAGPIIVLLAGLVCAWIALTVEEPTYSAPATADYEGLVPVAIAGEVPEGCVVRSFDIDGICCEGCAGKLFVAMTELDGVRQAAVDTVLKRAEAVVPAEFDVATLQGALTFGKYSATPVDRVD